MRAHVASFEMVTVFVSPTATTFVPPGVATTPSASDTTTADTGFTNAPDVSTTFPFASTVGLLPTTGLLSKSVPAWRP